MDTHVQAYKTDLYKKSVINMGTKLYNKMPGYIKKWSIKSPLRKS